MANPHGTPIWYELHTPDHAATKRFYEGVVGWRIDPKPPGDIDYRAIHAGDATIGGIMQLTEAMTTGGATPGWLGYLAADDVDATAARVTAAGGRVVTPPFDLPGVGRIALVADPAGAPFYLMRGAGEGDSTAFSPETPGHGAWHEYWTNDAAGALAFYEGVFGWENPHTMAGPTGGYRFLHRGDQVLGAIGESGTAPVPPRWTFYFHVPDLDAAIAEVTAGGGAITRGPDAVPGGSRVVVGTDSHGATFALVAPPASHAEAAQ